MKFSQATPPVSFAPITLVIESFAELDALLSAVCVCSEGDTEEFVGTLHKSTDEESAVEFLGILREELFVPFHNGTPS